MVTSNKLDTERVDIFGLGAILLEVVTLDSVLTIYEKEGVIREDFLERFFLKAG